jgi:hypothetical protein
MQMLTHQGPEKSYRTPSNTGASHNYSSQIVARLAGQFARSSGLEIRDLALMHAFQTVSRQTKPLGRAPVSVDILSYRLIPKQGKDKKSSGNIKTR